MSDFASIKISQNFESLKLRVENKNWSSQNKARVEIENETGVFVESLVFEIEMKSCGSLGYKIGLAKFVLKKILKLNSGVQAKT